MEHRRQEHPERPLIRISSTFFWHLSSDFDLNPIPNLEDKALALRADRVNLGLYEGEEPTYTPMKVGQQVQKCASQPMQRLAG